MKTNITLILSSVQTPGDQIRDMLSHYEIVPDVTRNVDAVGRMLFSLSSAVAASGLIVIAGSLCGDLQTLVTVISKAVGRVMQPVHEAQKILSKEERFALRELPLGAEPYRANGFVCGFSLSQGAQRIVVLPDSASLLREILPQAFNPRQREADAVNTAARHAEWITEDQILAAIRKNSLAEEEKLPATAAAQAGAAGEPSLAAHLQESVPPREKGSASQEKPLEPAPSQSGATLLRMIDSAFLQEAVPEIDVMQVAEVPEPCRPKRKKKALRAWMTAICCLLVAAAGLFVFYLGWGCDMLADYAVEKAREYYAEGSSGGAAVPEDSMLPKFASLYSHNKDTVGWLRITGTGIDYPVMDHKNGYYEKHNFLRLPDPAGTPALAAAVSLQGENRNLVVEGSSPGGGRLLEELQNYRNIDYLQRHPVFQMDTLYNRGDWAVFAVCLINTDLKNGSVFPYDTVYFASEEAFEEHLEGLRVRSMAITHTEVSAEDQILTLVTDTNDFDGAKILVAARKVRENESVYDFYGSVRINPTAVMPAVWQSAFGVLSAELDETETDAPTEAPATDATTEPETTTEAPTEAPTQAPTEAKQKPKPKPTESIPAGETDPEEPVPTAPPDVKPPVSGITFVYNGKEVSDPMEVVIARIVQVEIGASAPMEAMKAQAVAIYSFLLNRSPGRVIAISGLAYTSATPSSRCLQAAQAVAYEAILDSSGNPISAQFFAISAGRTANSADIWGGYAPYLVSVDSPYDVGCSGYATSYDISAADLASQVKSAENVDLTLCANKADWVKITGRDANGVYVSKVLLGNSHTVSGNRMRYIIGGSKIRSHSFEVSYRPDSDTFHFDVKGYGHGVGMSQMGAVGMANRGYDYRQILSHYYSIGSWGGSIRKYTR